LYLRHQFQALSGCAQRTEALVQSLDDSDAAFAVYFGNERCLHFVFGHGVQAPV
jgi:hypothetical protein